MGFQLPTSTGDRRISEPSMFNVIWLYDYLIDIHIPQRHSWRWLSFSLSVGYVSFLEVTFRLVFISFSRPGFGAASFLLSAPTSRADGQQMFIGAGARCRVFYKTVSFFLGGEVLNGLIRCEFHFFEYVVSWKSKWFKTDSSNFNLDFGTYVQHDSTPAGSEGNGFSKRLMVWALLPSLVCPINRAIMRLPGKRRWFGAHAGRF